MADALGKGSRASHSRARIQSDKSMAAGNLASPPSTNTPPTSKTKPNLHHVNLEPPSLRAQPGSDSINPDALTRALKDFEDAGRQRERTPGSSPSRKRQRVYGDRYGTFCLGTCVLPPGVLLRLRAMVLTSFA